MRIPGSDHSDRRYVEKIGVDELAEAFSVSPVAILKWMKRGIPWQHRAKFKRIAAAKRIRLPADFAENRSHRAAA